VTTELVVATPAFLDLTFVGLEGLPALGEEKFAGDLVRSPGGGAITAVAASRLGLRSALVAPLGDDLFGEFVRAELEREGVTFAGQLTPRTPQTLVMPCGDDRAMITVDPGPRARAADVEALMPAAVAANLEQLNLVPDGSPIYLTCGDDDARAFAGRIPPAVKRARLLALDQQDALILTRAGTLEDALALLAQAIDTVLVTRGVNGTVGMVGGVRTETPSYASGPAVDTTGDRDLLCAAYAWADLRGADARAATAWAQLYADLALTVPTATGGAATEARLLEEGAARGLEPPPRAPGG
jgi:sugar/nucleoside kinase (ribokinase family)